MQLGEEKLKKLRLGGYLLTSTDRIADYLRRLHEENKILDKEINQSESAGA